MNRKITIKQAHEIRTLKSLGWKLKDIALKYDLSITSVSRICCNETYVY